jgi:hypothetical protein
MNSEEKYVGSNGNDSDNVLPFNGSYNGSSGETADNRPLITSELIQRCLHRPTDEVAWKEFIRRFTPTIRTTVEKSFQLKEKEGERTRQYNAEMVETVVQIVYYKLTRDRCKALSVLEGRAVKPYLTMVSISTALDYLRGGKYL